MEIIIKSRAHLGYDLDILEDKVRIMLGDDGKITGGGYGVDGWLLYVEMVRDLTEQELNRFAASVGRMKTPVGTCVECTGQDGSRRTVTVRAEPALPE